MCNRSINNKYEVISSLTSSRASLKWTIKHFSLCYLKNDAFVSPEFFTPGGGSWSLQIYPQSSTYPGKVAIYLVQNASEWVSRTVDYRISLRDGLGADRYIHENKSDFQNVKASGASFIDLKSLLEEKRDEFLPDDAFTVYCELVYVCDLVHDPMIKNGVKESTSECPTDDGSVDKLMMDFKKIFEKQKYCDVTLLSADGQKFPAHKAILEERSSVFAAMFQHDMTESRLGEVLIEDIDGSILKHLLHYVYTAKVDEISDSDVSRLYAAADKYNIETLKKKCVHHLLNNLSVDNVCDAIVLADMFKEERLKESALSFLHKDASTVIKSDSWKDFMKEHSYLAAGILETIVLDKNV